jgi:hypothetical protein
MVEVVYDEDELDVRAMITTIITFSVGGPPLERDSLTIGDTIASPNPS